jgi:diguanylate cyclase (GGDEF)-like protein/PAS domain S-box-containing protein
MPSYRPFARPHARLVAAIAAVSLLVLGAFLADILDSRRLLLERAEYSSEDLCRLLAERLDGALKEAGARDASEAEFSIFGRELDSLSLGGTRFVAIADLEGKLIARRPGTASSLGVDPRDREMRDLIEEAARASLASDVVVSSGGKYLYSALAGDRGFVAVVGESRSDLLAEWRKKVLAYSLAMAAVAALMALLALTVSKELRRGSEMAARLVAMESASDMIVIADLEGRAQYVNPAFERATGVPRAGAIGSRSAIFGPSVPEADAAAALGAVVAGSGWRGEVAAARADGEEYVEEIAVSPVPGPDGAPLGVVAIKRDVTERRRLQERLERLAHYDSLTGLPNRALFFDRLCGAVSRGRREGRRFGLLFIDLDRFKAVNDRYGHQAGDAVLVETARRLKDAIRDSDTAGRMGGDEFIVLLENISRSEDAESFASKVRASLSAPVGLPSGDVVSIGASVGSAAYPDDGDDGEAVLKAADSAMYALKVKADGRS